MKLKELIKEIAVCYRFLMLWLWFVGGRVLNIRVDVRNLFNMIWDLF